MTSPQQEGRDGANHEFVAVWNEIETLRCRQSWMKMEPALVRELLELREFRKGHPKVASPTPPAKRSKSELVQWLEATVMFDGYVEREISRLTRKADALRSGAFADIGMSDRDERERNDAIAMRAMELAGVPDTPFSPTPQEEA